MSILKANRIENLTTTDGGININNSGKVGIGTDSPGQHLTIKRTGGQTQVSLISDTNESGAIYFGDTASTNRGVVLYDHGQDSLQLYSAGSERLRFGSSGQVGIAGANYGTSGQALLSQGSSSAPQWGDVAADGAFRSTQVFTSSGTWTKPSGLKRVRVYVTGGGGGGKGRTSTGSEGGTGGAAGGTAIKVIEASSLGSTETVTVGAGGSASTNSNDQAGSGGTSSFGSHCSASGGDGGDRPGGSPYISGGVGSSGDLNIRGSAPITSRETVDDSGSPGGDSFFGGGGRSAKTDGTYAHGATGQLGSGGGGGNTSGGGAAGGAGVVYVEQFF